MDLQKVRDRTPDELFIRKKEFLKICDILDDLNINYFLQTGVLLGAVRENDFIKWDWGVDISVFTDEFKNQIDPLTLSLKKANFEIIYVLNKKNDLKIYFKGKYPKDVTGYTIFSWNYSKKNDFYWRRNYSVPSKFLKSFSSVFFLGRKFRCPKNPEEYLTYAYGNWKKPIRTSDKEIYNSNDYHKLQKVFLWKKIIHVFKRNLNYIKKKIKL